MKIDSYAVKMSSASTMSKSLTVSEKLKAGSIGSTGGLLTGSGNNMLGGGLLTGNRNNMLGGGLLGGLFGGGIFNGNNGSRDHLALSQSARERLSNISRLLARSDQLASARTNQSEGVRQSGVELSDKDRLKLALIERMVEAITGRKYKFNMFENFSAHAGNMFFVNQNIQMIDGGFTIERVEQYHEYQEMTFQASGIVNTSDGRQIKFDINLFSSYEFSSSVTTQIAARLADPLIINFNGTLPEFTKDRYEFDLTIDGTPDKIFMPTNGSGFLAYDKNGDGVINDGSELFGATTGNGFWELMAYDEDGNGWIDEGDSIFEHLKIMFVDKDSGEYMLITLKEAGIGAIYLGSTAADYEIKGADNELVGVVRRNGIFLNEDGTVGSIHHIDLTV